MSSGDDATITTDKRGRGRPRKYPIGQSPSEKLKAARENGLQRGRGRPRKLPISDIDAPAQISLPPLQSPDEDDLDAILNDRSARGSATTTASTSEQKRGRGRPPKHKANPEQEEQLERSAPKSKAAKASSRK